MPEKASTKASVPKEGRHFAGLDAADKIDEAFETYRKSDKGKEAYKRYQTSEKGKETFRRYFSSKKGKAAVRKWLDSPKGKKRSNDKTTTRRIFARAKKLLEMYPELSTDDCLNIAWGEVVEKEGT